MEQIAKRAGVDAEQLRREMRPTPPSPTRAALHEMLRQIDERGVRQLEPITVTAGFLRQLSEEIEGDEILTLLTIARGIEWGAILFGPAHSPPEEREKLFQFAQQLRKMGLYR